VIETLNGKLESLYVPLISIVERLINFLLFWKIGSLGTMWWLKRMGR